MSLNETGLFYKLHKRYYVLLHFKQRKKDKNLNFSYNSQHNKTWKWFLRGEKNLININLW